MSILVAIGWIIVGTAAVGVLATFWDEVRQWLNSVAADFIEKHLGYSARQKMQKAVTCIDKVVNKIRNNSVIYTKKNNLDTYYDKTTILAETSIYEIDQKVLNEINKRGEIVQEFEYRQ